jgi:hypothetical protein
MGFEFMTSLNGDLDVAKFKSFLDLFETSALLLPVDIVIEVCAKMIENHMEGKMRSCLLLLI